MPSDLSLPSGLDTMAILKLFIIPVGGGIPAGVLLAQAKGVVWPYTTIIYLVSDILLACVFEPFLRLIAITCSKITFLSRLSNAMKAASARTAEQLHGTGAGPIALIMIAFGVDPMTGRATALAAGHGFIAGWTFAIIGDMLYFAVIAITTLKLNSYIKNPNLTMLLVLTGMFCIPPLIRRIRAKQQKKL